MSSVRKRGKQYGTEVCSFWITNRKRNFILKQQAPLERLDTDWFLSSIMIHLSAKCQELLEDKYNVCTQKGWIFPAIPSHYFPIGLLSHMQQCLSCGLTSELLKLISGMSMYNWGSSLRRSRYLTCNRKPRHKMLLPCHGFHCGGEPLPPVIGDYSGQTCLFQSPISRDGNSWVRTSGIRNL